MPDVPKALGKITDMERALRTVKKDMRKRKGAPMVPRELDALCATILSDLLDIRLSLEDKPKPKIKNERDDLPTMFRRED